MNQQPDTTAPGATDAADPATDEASSQLKDSRRKPCPCGSGKKFKNCHEGQADFAPPADGLPTVAAPAGAAAKHFPGKDLKNIASQRPFRAYFRKRG